MHSVACLIQQVNELDWWERWPDACQHCGGRGSWYTYGSMWEPPDGGPCPSCAEDYRCGRCGQTCLIASDGPDTGDGSIACPWCGWTEVAELQDADMIAPEVECWGDCEDVCGDCGVTIPAVPFASVPLCVPCRAAYEPAALRAWVLWLMDLYDRVRRD